MPKKNVLTILNKTIGFFLILMGTTLLFIRNVRQYTFFLQAYSFEMFLLSPIIIILGLNLVCMDIKARCIHIGRKLLFGVAMIYLVILSASWFSINILY